MKRFRNILVVYSDNPGGDDVLVQAVGLARASGASLTIVKACAPPHPLDMVAEDRRRLKRLLPWLEHEGVADIELEVVVGTPHAEIMRLVQARRHDLVIVGTDGERSIRDLIFGNTAINLMLQCPCAVWVVKNGQDAPCANVVAAVGLDGAEDGDGRDAEIVDLAASLSQAHEARLHLVHFWQAEGRENDMLRSEIQPHTKDGIIERNECARRDAIARLIDDLPAPPSDAVIHVKRGSASAEMTDLAETLSADLVVMGAGFRRGVTRLLAGSFAEAVLNGARCGVIAVKPCAFEAPVAAPRHDAQPQQVYASAR